MDSTVNRQAEMVTPASILAGYGVDFSLSETPPKVLEYSKLLLLDLIGAALAGVDTPESIAAADAASRLHGPGPSVIWGTWSTSSPAGAALVNGITAHARELDDFGGVDHSGAVVVPAILALAEAQPRTSGRKLLEAMIVGYEIGRRVLDACGGYRPHNHEDGWHSTATCGCFASAAACAKILGLEKLPFTWALGLAGGFSGGTWAFIDDGAMSKRYNAGRAAETGVTAASLAQAGFSGPIHVFDAEWGGFFKTYARTAAQPEKLTAGLGENYAIMRSGIKPYAACRDIHSALDVILAARREHNLIPDDITRIEVRCIAEMKQMVGRTSAPETRRQAQLSLPYSLGVALTAGQASLEQYDEPFLSSAALRRTAGLVDMVVDDSLPYDSEPYISILLKDGRTIAGHVDHARGAWQNPLSLAETVEKYSLLARRVFSDDHAARLWETVLSIENLEDIKTLSQLLRKSGAAYDK